MAEFSEIAKIAKRMCDKHKGCCITSTCPLSSVYNGKHIRCDKLMAEYPEEYERICLVWEKENPEISNKDKLYRIVKEAFGKTMATEIIRYVDIDNSCTFIKCSRTCSECENKNFWNKPYAEPKED